MALGETLSKVFDVINKVLAFVVLLAYVLFAINANWPFYSDVNWLVQAIDIIRQFGPIVVCCLIMVEFAIKRNLLLQILVYALIALVIIFSCFPDTWNSIVSSIG